MYNINPLILGDRARHLIDQVANDCEAGTLGSATVAVYDTAWVSMIYRHDQWIFPTCFQYLLDTQAVNGGWDSGYSLDDSLLDTMASLLALVTHAKGPNADVSHDMSDLQARISKAKSYLEANLQIWNVNTTMNVGFEILVPAILSMLEIEDIHFNFLGRQALNALKTSKMNKLDLESFYSSPSAQLHSLEGLVGRIDFDQLSLQKTLGSMMGSPASTAAYLIHAAVWDDEAERYIQKAIDNGSGQSSGGVPSVFPMPVFESTWVLTTLLQSGFQAAELGKDNVYKVAGWIEDLFRRQDGLLGFAPSVIADADDTAKALYALNLLGKNARPHKLVAHFGTQSGCFRTYLGERDASLSANCNALNALLFSPDVQGFTAEIISSATFLCDLWWRGEVKDKWNVSPQYSRMLLAEVLFRLLYLWDVGLLSSMPPNLLRDRIPVVLTQILNRTLFEQTVDGGWGLYESAETTAYGVLTLKAVYSLPWHTLLHESTMSSIHLGQSKLMQSQQDWTKPSHLWIEKVRYGSATLSEAYCLAAMHPLPTAHEWSFQTASLVEIPSKAILDSVDLISTLDEFRREPPWKLKASAVEGYTFLQQLKSARTDILPRQREANNKYLAFVPFTWILANNLYGLDLRANLLWDMMVLTVCNFRIDEYMETVIAKCSGADLEQIKSIIHDLCSVGQSDRLKISEAFTDSVAKSNGEPNLPSVLRCKPKGTIARMPSGKANRLDTIAMEANEKYAVPPLTNFCAVISHYTRAMLAHPHIIYASPTDHSHLRNSMHVFLLSHIAQVADNSRFSTQASWLPSTPTIFATPRTSFYTWAHSTGADSVSCPFSFAFFTCLLGAAANPSAHTKPQKPVANDYFGSVRQKYLAEDLCSHLAVMSRLYNDFGSVVRDRVEANVNSVNFPEFHSNAVDHQQCASSSDNNEVSEKPVCEVNLKGDLLELARLERANVDLACARLLEDIEGQPKENGVGGQTIKANAVRLFVGVAKLYADIYVARDLSNPIAKQI